MQDWNSPWSESDGMSRTSPYPTSSRPQAAPLQFMWMCCFMASISSVVNGREKQPPTVWAKVRPALQLNSTMGRPYMPTLGSVVWADVLAVQSAFNACCRASKEGGTPSVGSCTVQMRHATAVQTLGSAGACPM